MPCIIKIKACLVVFNRHLRHLELQVGEALLGLVALDRSLLLGLEHALIVLVHAAALAVRLGRDLGGLGPRCCCADEDSRL